MNLHKGNACVVTLQPSGRQIRAASGSILRKILFKRNTEMPCGGHGECRGCKVRVLTGAATPTDTETARFKQHELADGWRLACQTKVTSDMAIETRTWMEPCIRPEAPSPVQRGIAQATIAYIVIAALRRLFRRKN